jgi:23S rRNA (cytidine1920-2'-O)/16S rRNA (cytidine1409-2'-O)-methyltransferase
MAQRLDRQLVENGLFPSRERAQSAIMAGHVWVDGKQIDKAGYQISPTQQIEVRGADSPYVSRGGLKLARALAEFTIDLNGRTCIDVGASTGGFTDCMLQSGAAKVFAVDVGYGQLDWSLRTDPRVVVMERTNARYLQPEQFDTVPDFASIDVSFISLSKILPAVVPLLTPDAELTTLIKPQFEAGRDRVGKKGVVRSAEVHIEVLQETIKMAQSLELNCLGLTYSPIKGPEGNIEFLAYWRKGDQVPGGNIIDPECTVMEAHRTLSLQK